MIEWPTTKVSGAVMLVKSAILEFMSTPKKNRSNDRHKPRRMVAVSARLAEALEVMGEPREAKLTEMVRNAIVFYLESNGQLPPPKTK
jgi:hypothetical protein